MGTAAERGRPARVYDRQPGPGREEATLIDRSGMRRRRGGCGLRAAGEACLLDPPWVLLLLVTLRFRAFACSSALLFGEEGGSAGEIRDITFFLSLIYLNPAYGLQ